VATSYRTKSPSSAVNSTPVGPPVGDEREERRGEKRGEERRAIKEDNGIVGGVRDKPGISISILNEECSDGELCDGHHATTT
jgi:hypothetical protein